MSVSRNLLLALAHNPSFARRAARAPFVRRSVARFMPGERLDDALAAAADLHARGIAAMITKLGENLTDLREADAVVRHYLDALDRIEAAGVDAQISVKPTQLGLDLDGSLCARHLDCLAERANQLGRFVWIDMESSAYVDRTLDLFRRTRERFANTGIALQAYLRRTEVDVRTLLPLSPVIRVVKGAYLEPRSMAFSTKAEVDENYYRLAALVLGREGRRHRAGLQIATHDARLVNRVAALAAADGVPAGEYEHAMLYGIGRSLQERLARSGHRVRVLISYGDYWFPWFMRRLAERPANVWFVLKNLL
jgi:proline dehydrogenase